jgi:single-strand DNA-binding protein
MNGTAVVRFTVATNKRHKDQKGIWQETTTWHNVVAFGPMAERAAAVKTGSLLFIEGELNYREQERQVEAAGVGQVAVRWPITEIVASSVAVLNRGASPSCRKPHDGAAA